MTSLVEAVPPAPENPEIGAERNLVAGALAGEVERSPVLVRGKVDRPGRDRGALFELERAAVDHWRVGDAAGLDVLQAAAVDRRVGRRPAGANDLLAAADEWCRSLRPDRNPEPSPRYWTPPLSLSCWSRSPFPH